MKVYILGVPYEVERGYVIGKDLGCIDHVRQYITIDDDLEYDSVVETLLHEILHGIEYSFGLDLDDRIIGAMSRGLYSVLVDPQNEALWAAIAGSDEIMEENDVGCDAPKVLEGTCPGCNCSWTMCYCGDSEVPAGEGNSEHGEPHVEVEPLQDSERRPRWTDPEAESSRKGFADACRRAEETIRRSTITTTGDDLSGPNSGDPFDYQW